MLKRETPVEKLRKNSHTQVQGVSEERLRKACVWVSIRCPGRMLTLEQIGSIMGFRANGSAKSKLTLCENFGTLPV